MNNVQFPGVNCRMGPPPGVSEEECSTITAYRGELTDGRPIIVSAWEPTPDEMETLVKTGRIYLYIWGVGMPPVALDVQEPFGWSEEMSLWNKFYHDLVTAKDDAKGVLAAQILNNSNAETAAKLVEGLTADARAALEAALHKTPAPTERKSMQQVMDEANKPKPSPEEGRVVKRTDPTVAPAEAGPTGPADSTVASPSPGASGTVKK